MTHDAARTMIGVLPGIGPAGTTAMLIPLSASLGPTPANIMLAAIYYRAQYGRTISSVLINTPGEASSANWMSRWHPSHSPSFSAR